MNYKNVRWTITILAGLLCVAGAALAAPAELGRLLIERDGALYDEGPIHADRLVTSRDEPAVLELNNGRVVRLAAATTVLGRQGADGIIEITVGAGRAFVRSPRGELLEAGKNSRFTLEPSRGGAETIWSFDGPDAPQRNATEGDEHRPGRRVGSRAARPSGR